ncbi:hypothetical protein NFJ02_10g01480 [Pycnococcus provasolii]
MTIPMLVAALNGKEKSVAELVRMVAPRLHEVSPIALAAAPGEGQVGHGSRPAMAAVGSVLGERTNRKTKIEDRTLLQTHTLLRMVTVLDTPAPSSTSCTPRQA